MKTLSTGLAFLLAGCGGTVIEGSIVDVAGKPIPGARAAAFGTTCMDQTDEQGHFELKCPAGEYDLIFSADGYTDERMTLAATERKTYDLGPQTLVKIPESKGLFLLVNDSYEAMKPGELVGRRKKEGGTVTRSFCLDREASQPNEVPAGEATFFDYEHPGWRPFRLDDEGCAYRDRKNKQHRWKVEYRERAKFTSKEVNEGKRLVTIDFEPGEYFIADWKGFFVPVEGESDEKRYGGYWIVVK